MVKLYICPIIGDGKTPLTAYRPKISDYKTVSCSAIMPSYPDGTPKSNWTLVEVKSNDFTMIDTDPEAIDIFDGFTTAMDMTELKTFLKTHLVGDIPKIKRDKIQNYLLSKGIDLAGITLSTTLLELVNRTQYKIMPEVTLETWRTK